VPEVVRQWDGLARRVGDDDGCGNLSGALAITNSRNLHFALRHWSDIGAQHWPRPVSHDNPGPGCSRRVNAGQRQAVL